MPAQQQNPLPSDFSYPVLNSNPVTQPAVNSTIPSPNDLSQQLPSTPAASSSIGSQVVEPPVQSQGDKKENAFSKFAKKLLGFPSSFVIRGVQPPFHVKICSIIK